MGYNPKKGEVALFPYKSEGKFKLNEVRLIGPDSHKTGKRLFVNVSRRSI